MELKQEDVINILKMIDEAPVGRFSLRVGELELEVAKGVPGGAPLAPGPAPETGPVTDAPAPAAAPDVDDGDGEGLESITAPVLGMFYRRPEPSAPPYVEEGDLVVEDTTVALIEVMKLFTPVKAGIKGRIRRISVDNGALVEFGQDLFLVEKL
jgi:acetyl-CoA carboxylase biotin carboxyl carrier protein